MRLLMMEIYKRGGEAVWLYRGVQRALRRRGVLGTARQALVVLLYLLRELRPSRFRARAAERAADAAFDRTYGVDTGGKTKPGIISPAAEGDAERAADVAFYRTYGVDNGGKIQPSAMHEDQNYNRNYAVH